MRIGVFDSGLGGLTVAREIKKLHPKSQIVYIGDTARVPWGVRSSKVIKKFSLETLRFLESKNVDLIIVACHTASSVALDFLKTKTKLPVYGVITPAAEKAKLITKGRVGLLGTPTTIKSKAWEKAILNNKKTVKVFQKEAPLFVPLVEEGLENHKITKIIAKDYLAPLLKNKIDTVVLACTHYPLLMGVIRKAMPSDVQLINPGIELAKMLRIEGGKTDGKDEFYFTDLTDRVQSRLDIFYGRKVKNVSEVELGNEYGALR